MKLQRSIEIKATPDKIWSFLVEPENIMKWCEPINVIRYTSQNRGGLQSTFYFEEKAIEQIMKLHFVVTEWVPNRSVAFKMTSGNLVRDYTQRYTIETIPSGNRVTCVEEVTLPFGFMGKFVGLFRRFISNHLLEKMLLNLKLVTEV